jgi:hypothetical protein
MKIKHKQKEKGEILEKNEIKDNIT